jgi:hypothetical protein
MHINKLFAWMFIVKYRPYGFVWFKKIFNLNTVMYSLMIRSRNVNPLKILLKCRGTHRLYMYIVQKPFAGRNSASD